MLDTSWNYNAPKRDAEPPVYISHNRNYKFIIAIPQWIYKGETGLFVLIRYNFSGFYGIT